MEEKDDVLCNPTQDSRRKRCKDSLICVPSGRPALEDNCDWLNRLPDCLLINILSRLSIKEAIKTSLLSKRWRYLWRFNPCLDFESVEMGRMYEKTTFINLCLLNHEKTKVRKLYMSIMYDNQDITSVDSWINFALRTNVEELKLDLLDGLVPSDYSFFDCPVYKLPHSLYRCGSLTKLILHGCDLNLPTSLHLSSLKTLVLHHLGFASDAIERLTSACPVLDNLFLKDCNRYSSLNISITNVHVKSLAIEDYRDPESFPYELFPITIDAPNLLSLKFCSMLQRSNYVIKNLESVTTANLATVGEIGGFDDPFDDDNKFHNVALAEILISVPHVKDLKLSSWCVQVLSARKVQRIDPHLIDAVNVEFCTGFTKRELPGIAYLMQSVPCVENLSINITEFAESEKEMEFELKEHEYWKSLGPSFSSSVLQNTKIINISGFHRMHSFFKGGLGDLNRCVENEIEFVMFLLENSKALETMIISTDKFRCDRSTSRKLIERLTQKLSGFPKASKNAELFIM